MNKRSPYPSTRSPRFPNTQPTTMRHGAVLLLVILSVSSSEAQIWKKIAGIGGKISDISNGSWTKLVKNYVKSFFDNLVERAEKAFVKFTSNCEYLGGKWWSKNDDKNWNETNKQTAFFLNMKKHKRFQWLRNASFNFLFLSLYNMSNGKMTYIVWMYPPWKIKMTMWSFWLFLENWESCELQKSILKF